jgi:hypothetical protein
MGDKDWEAILEAKSLAYIKKLDEDSMQNQLRLVDIDWNYVFDIRAVRAGEKDKKKIC